MNNQQAKLQVVEFIHTMRIIRRSTLIRLLEHYLGEKKDATWSVYIHRLIQESDLVYLRKNNGQEESIIGTEEKQGIPLLEVQAGHELRVTEVAVEFIRAGFIWVPALATGKGASKISDGVAWLGEYRIEVEIELSAKKQSRWKGIIDRYRNQQKTSPFGVCYIFGNDGLRRSFRNLMAAEKTTGYWYLGVTDSDQVKERQKTDAAIVTEVKSAIENGAIHTPQQNPDTQTTLTIENHPDNHPEFAPQPIYSQAELARQKLAQYREEKGKNK